MPNNAILFLSKIEYAEELINNIKCLGNDVSEFSEDILKSLQGVEENVRIMKEKTQEKTGMEEFARKMAMEGIYIESIRMIDKIIASLENYLLYLQIISNCNSINSLEKIGEAELDNVVNSLIGELKKVKREDWDCFLDYDKTIKLLYETIYRIIKLEYVNSNLTSSKLYNYISLDKTDMIFISALIMEDIRKTRESGRSTAKLEQIISEINANPFDSEVYFNEELIKAIASIYEGKRIINTSIKKVLVLSNDYQENLLEIEKTKGKYDKIESTIVSTRDALMRKKKQKFRDIFRIMTSCILSVSICGTLFMGLLSEKTKKIKTIKTVTNSTTLDLKNQEEDYLPEDGNYVYLEMFDPWEKDVSGYSRDVYKYSLPYDEYKDKELEEILAYENLYPLVLALFDAEKNTEFSQELAYTDLYSDTFYELIKIEQIPEDFIYIPLVTDRVLRGFMISFFVFFSGACIFGAKTLWLENQEKHMWGEAKLRKYEDEINKLISDREELEKKIAYLLSTNQEIKMRYEEILKEPALKEMLSGFIKNECHELESDSIEGFDFSEVKRRILQK